MSKLLQELTGAKYTEVHNDMPGGCVYVWFGGHGVHEYNAAGEELDFFNVGDFSKNQATLKEVKAGIKRWCKDKQKDKQKMRA